MGVIMSKDIPIQKVHKAFADAIKRRDCRCMIKTSPCWGSLEASHFYTKGANPSLMFYPPNAYAQCQKHHREHHQVSAKPYVMFMQNCHSDDLEYMRKARNGFIKYTDELKAEIIRLCNADDLLGLKILIEKEIKMNE